MPDITELSDQELTALKDRAEPDITKIPDEQLLSLKTEAEKPAPQRSAEIGVSMADAIHEGKFESRLGAPVHPYEPDRTAPLIGQRPASSRITAPGPDRRSVDDFINKHVAIGDLKDEFEQTHGQPFDEIQFRKALQSRLQQRTWEEVNQPNTYGQQFQAQLGRALPFMQGLSNRDYKDAKDRFESGNATRMDMHTIARFENFQKSVAERNGAQDLGDVVSKIPGLIGTVSRGGVTALTAEGAYTGATERAIHNGGDITDLKNAGPAVAMGAAQAAVMGQAGKLFPAITNPIARALAGIGTGMAEMEGVNVAAGAIDQALPKEYQTGTRFGLAGQLYRGEYGDAAVNAVGQGLTLGALGAAHQAEAKARELDARNATPQERAVELEKTQADAQAKPPVPTPQAAIKAGMVRTKAGDLPVSVARMLGLDAISDAKGANPASGEPGATAPPNGTPDATVAQEAVKATPREVADGMTKQLQDAQKALLDAKAAERRESTNAKMGVANTADDATAARQEAQRSVKRLLVQTDAARVAAADWEASQQPKPIVPANLGVSEALVPGLKKMPAGFPPGFAERQAEVMDARRQQIAEADTPDGRDPQTATNETAVVRKPTVTNETVAPVEAVNPPAVDTPPKVAEAPKALSEQHQAALDAFEGGAKSYRQLGKALGVSHTKAGQLLKEARSIQEQQGVVSYPEATGKAGETVPNFGAVEGADELSTVGSLRTVDEIKTDAQTAEWLGLDKSAKPKDIDAALEAAHKEAISEAEAEHTPAEIEEARRRGEAEADAAIAAERNAATSDAEPAAGRADRSRGDAAGGTDELTPAQRRQMLDQAIESDAGWNGESYGPDDVYSKRPAQPAAGQEWPEQPLKRRMLKTAVDWLKAEEGFITLNQAEDFLREKSRAIDNVVRELSQESFPRTRRGDRRVSELLSEHVAAPQWARDAAPFLSEQIMGKKFTETEDRYFGSVANELHLRHTKAVHDAAAAKANTDLATAKAALAAAKTPGDQFVARRAVKKLTREAAKANDLAQGVVSEIGKPSSVLKSEAEYQRGLADPRFADVVKKYQKHMVPISDDMFRVGNGLGPNDPIPSSTQVPGFPMHMMPLGEDRVGAGGKVGNPRNLKVPKLGITYQRTGSSEHGYENRLSEIIAHTLSENAAGAARARLVTHLVETKQGVLTRPGGLPATVNGEKAVLVPFTNPPQPLLKALVRMMSPGDRARLKGQRGEIGLAVPESYQHELKTGLKTVDPSKPVPGFATVNKLSMSGFNEGFGHLHNILSGVLAPKTIRQLPKAIYDGIRGDTNFQSRLVELSRIGAQKGGHIESDAIFNGKYSPKGIMGRGLHAMNNVMRVAGDRAYDALVKSGNAPDTQSGRRDFINYWQGNYGREATNAVVRWARDTKIGPFAVAGTTAVTKGIRTGLMGFHGVEGGGVVAGAKMRAEVLAKIVGLGFATSAAVNYLLHKRIDGDPSVPVGNIMLGKTKSGKSISVVNPFVDVTRRGARATGLLAWVDGWRKHDKPGEIGKRQFEQATETLAHPILGPGANAVHTLLTGRNAIGQHVAEPIRRGDNPYPGNAQAALLNMIPPLATIMDANSPKRENLRVGELPRTLKDRLEQKRVEAPWYERVSSMFGKFGPQFRSQPKHKK